MSLLRVSMVEWKLSDFAITNQYSLLTDCPDINSAYEWNIWITNSYYKGLSNFFWDAMSYFFPSYVIGGKIIKILKFFEN